MRKAAPAKPLLDFINIQLFPTLKELPGDLKRNPRAYVIHAAFEDTFNYMKSGQLLRQVINKINGIDFNRQADRHQFNDIYEKLLRDLQSAGNAGEFYTPRAVTQFMVDMVDPQLGERVLDPACGTGVRCFTLSATTKGIFRDNFFKFIDISTRAAEQHYLKKGDLLIQRANSLEHVGIAAIYEGNDDEYTFPDLMMRMRVLPSLIANKYLHLWLISRDARSYMRANATGTQGNMPKVNQVVVRKTPVPLPPLAEQHRIVTHVEHLRRLCADLRNRLNQSRDTRTHLADVLVADAVQS